MDKTIEQMARELGFGPTRQEVCFEGFTDWMMCQWRLSCTECIMKHHTPAEIRAKYAELVKNGGERDESKKSPKVHLRLR